MPSRREFLRTSFSSSTLLMIGSQLFAKSGDLTSLSLQEASMLVQSKAVSPVDLTRACLERIQRLNPTLNAFITVTAEQALAQADALEKERQRGRSRGPLHGIPIALKDNIDTEGVKTTAASAFFANRIPTEDAEVVRRLKAAGAVIIGKLNMHEFASGTTSTISHFGPVHNPWNLDRIVGGSSGFSAVAVAAGLCYGTIWHRHGRICPVARRLLWHCWIETNLWLGQCTRSNSDLLVVRPRGSQCAEPLLILPFFSLQ